MRRGRENGTARLVWAFEWVPAINKSRDFTLWNFISTRDDRADVCFMLVPDSVRAALKWVYSIQTVSSIQRCRPLNTVEAFCS